MQRMEVQFEGRVQGVGFRYTTASVASRWQVTGYVKNQDDGTVLLVAEGDVQELQGFLKAVCDEMEGNIESKQVHYYAASGQWSQFSIHR